MNEENLTFMPIHADFAETQVGSTIISIVDISSIIVNRL